MKTGSLDAVTNRATFQSERQIIDSETGEAVDLTGCSIVFEVRRRGCYGALLSATTDNGSILFADAYTYQVNFTLDQMRTLCAETYDVGLTFKRSGFTTEIIVGTLPVLDGVVS